MSKAPRSPVNQLIEKLRADLADIAERAREVDLAPPGKRALNAEIGKAAGDLNALLAELDPISRPGTVFDPGNPRTIGFFIALAMTAQERRPIRELQDFYGSGVYAIYYRGCPSSKHLAQLAA